jgi:serine/threonine protein kinase
MSLYIFHMSNSSYNVRSTFFLKLEELFFKLLVPLSDQQRRAQGPFIHKLRDYFSTIFVVAMVTELLDCDLCAYILRFGRCQLPIPQVYTIAVQLCTALSFLVTKRILHRDLHMKNVLVKCDVDAERKSLPKALKQVVLSDFGRSVISSSTNASTCLPLTGAVYVSAYRPPEIVLCAGSHFTARGAWHGPPHICYTCFGDK